MTDDNVPRRWGAGLLARADKGLGSARRVFLWVFLPLAVLYLATGNHYWEPMDPFTNRLTAWSIATTASPVLEDHEVLRPSRAWIVDSERGPVSQYPPGAALLAVPGYLVLPDAPPSPIRLNHTIPPVLVDVPLPSAWPALMAAAGTTAAALAITAVLVLSLGYRPVIAVLGAWVGGTATAAWTVAGDSLWQHGPNMFWLALAMYGAMRERWALVGFAFGFVALTRPPVLAIGIAVGLWLLWRRRLVEAVRMGVVALPGVVGLLLYNHWLFGTITLSGGYPETVVQSSVDRGIGTWLLNIVEMLVAHRYGLLSWSPVIGVAAVGGVLVWRGLPGWLKAFTIGGVGYLVMHMALHSSSSGGFGFWFYRYPLETILVCLPALIVGGARLLDEGPIARALVLGTSSFSITSHAVASTLWGSFR